MHRGHPVSLHFRAAPVGLQCSLLVFLLLFHSTFVAAQSHLKPCSTHFLLVLILSTCAHVVACPLHFHLISFDWEELKSFHLDCSIFSHQVSTAPTPQPYKLRSQVGVSC